MKKKYFIYALPIVLLASFWVYFQVNQSKVIDGFKVIPSNAYYVIESRQPVSSWTTFSKTEIWHILKQHPVMADLTKDADYLDEMVNENGKVLGWFNDANLIISAHPTSPKDYDFLFVVGLSKKAKKSVLLPSLKQLLKSIDYATTMVAIQDHEVLEAKDNAGATLYLVQMDNQLVCSYSKSLITQSIVTAKENTALHSDKSFRATYISVASDGLCKLYMPYGEIEGLLKCYFSDDLSGITNITNQLISSSFDFHATSEMWQLEGYTATDSANSSYVKAFTQSGVSTNEVGNVLSNRTAWALSVNFNSFDQFKQNLEAYLQESSNYGSYTKQINQLETLLGIDVKRDLTGWIGDEITIAQLRKNLTYNEKENAVVLLKSKDIDMARERLSFVARKVKKRTPALFKQIEYRNYTIQYLEIKGLFKLLFGKSFNKITKPYYVILDNYVIFSNSPYTLIGLIEDFENQRCLQNTKAFQNYQEQNKKSSVHLFVSPVNLHPVLLPMLDATSAKTIKGSKPYFDAFESFGLNLTAEGPGFKTHATLIKREEQEELELVEENEFKKLYALYAAERDINSDNFVVEWIEDGVYKKQFPGSDKVQIVADTKSGVLHGNYTEYHINGEKRLTGRYKMGRKKGTWKTYNQTGELIGKKKY